MSDAHHLVVVRLADGRYALDIAHVAEVAPMVELSPLPSRGGDDALAGLVNVRGVMLPVFSLRGLLGIEPAPITASTRIVLARLEDHVVGLIVDAVEGVQEAPDERLQPLQTRDGSGYEYATHVCDLDDGAALRIDLPNLLSAERLSVVSALSGESTRLEAKV